MREADMSMSTRPRRMSMVVLVVTALAVAILVATATVAEAVTPVERIWGADRYETSAELAWRAYSGGTDVVVIATGENWPDALAGGPLAHTVGGPILLTRRTDLPPVVSSMIQDTLGATTAYVLGGSSAIDPSVEVQLAAAGITTIHRLAGSDRYDTAKLIAQEIEDYDMDDVDTAYFATGQNFPDALAAGPFGAALKRPILLVERDSIPQPTQDAITGLALSKSYVLGGTAAISNAVMGSLPAPTRLGGSDRYETARIVAEHGLSQGGDDYHLYVATAEAFPDALTAAPLAAAGPFPIISVRGNAIPTASAQYINAHTTNITQLFVVGGTAAVSDQVKNDILALLP